MYINSACHFYQYILYIKNIVARERKFNNQSENETLVLSLAYVLFCFRLDDVLSKDATW